jgi:hypothetical protein
MMRYEVVPIPGKGKGMRATEEIKRGELVLKEKPIVRGTTRTPRQKDFEETVISEEDKKAFFALNDPDPTGPEDKKMFRIYQNNVFGHGLFLICSRMNHSCWPTVEMSSVDGTETEVRATQDIHPGDEITVSYLWTTGLKSRAKRQEYLQNWGFQCTCRLCSLPHEDMLANDRQRERVRESMAHTKSFFVRLGKDAPLAGHATRPQLKRTFLRTLEALEALDTGSLAGQAEPGVVKALLYLAALAEVAATPGLRTDLPGSDTAGGYMTRARARARMLGAMFLGDCETREAELDGIRVVFGVEGLCLAGEVDGPG